MATTIPIPPMTLQAGVNVLQDADVPPGSTGASLVITAPGFLPPMVLDVSADLIDGSSAVVSHFGMSVTDLGIDRHTGLPRTEIDMNFMWGDPSQAGWKIRASYTLTNGPLPISGGVLTVT